MKRIVITGSYCSKNKGDAAMRIAASRAIRQIIPDASITILSSYPEIDRDAYEGFPVVPCCRRSPSRALSMLARAFAWNAAHRLAKLDLRGLASPHELSVYRDADLILDLSGDGLTEEYGSKCLLSHFVPTILGLAFGKPVFICAQTLGPFHRTRPLARAIFNRVPVLTTREDLSMEVVRECRVTKPKMAVTGDMGFLLDPCPGGRVDELMALEGIPSQRPLIGLAVTRWFGHKLEIGHNLSQENFERTFASTIDSIIAMLGVEVVLISHVTGPEPERDDRQVAQRIRQLCQRRSSVHVIKGDYSPSETKGLIGRTSTFVGMRMHSNVAALSMRVPAVAIASGPKSHGIMAMAGQGKHVLELSDLSRDTLFTAVQEVWNDRASIHQELETVIPRVEEMSRRNILIIADLLNVSPQYGGTDGNIT